METTTNRMGLILFAVYSLLYCGFVFLSAFSPATMEITPLAGINLAVIYGFALIIFAFVLAAVYGWIFRGMNERSTDSRSNREGRGA